MREWSTTPASPALSCHAVYLTAHTKPKQQPFNKTKLHPTFESLCTLLASCPPSSLEDMKNLAKQRRFRAACQTRLAIPIKQVEQPPLSQLPNQNMPSVPTPPVQLHRCECQALCSLLCCVGFWETLPQAKQTGNKQITPMVTPAKPSAPRSNPKHPGQCLLWRQVWVFIHSSTNAVQMPPQKRTRSFSY